jgi:hypothetical protein
MPGGLGRYVAFASFSRDHFLTMPQYNFLASAALDGGTEVMVFVFSFAVGGAGGKVVPFPTWALNPVGNPDYCKRLT